MKFMKRMFGKTRKKKNRSPNRSPKNNQTFKLLNNSRAKINSGVTIDILNKMKQKYHVNTSGSKKQIANSLWKIAGFKMSDEDLEMISYLLPEKEQDIITKKIMIRRENPIHDYKGMWKPLPKSLNRMSRNELISNLKKFRDAWEVNTGRNQDLDNERLTNANKEVLEDILEFYYSNDAKLIAEDWLRK